jgi:predicted transcriptional regulator
VLARRWLAQAARDAEVVPMARLQAALAETGPDPVLLADQFGVDVIVLFRRLALVPGARWGVVICDGSGTITFRREVPGFALPRFGAACPLWPLYTALGRPMVPVQARLDMWGRVTRRFRALAFCAPRHPQGFGGPQLSEAAMLILPEDRGGDGPALAVGTSCRICGVAGCPARREPSILDGAGDGGL